ncbi:hypothetical protein [Streptomyces inhibens]|uniref:hypothetical protein n=1 Tax=Streptomyces inhibens TaxID=2293571 RepID=UPI001EE6B351|nr:hypothetical protein [Streptomyces inhibens]UKY54664.1 hypothetical protein KI385_41615 [Streptomyces inhibens]
MSTAYAQDTLGNAETNDEFGPVTSGSAGICGKDTDLTLRGPHDLFGAALPGVHVTF